MDVKLPHLAEGVESGTIVNVLVSVGDEVAKDQSLVEIETSKAIAPIPSPVAGKVTKIHVKAGDEIAVGRPLVSLSGNGAADEVAAAQKKAVTAEPEPEMEEETEVSSDDASDDLPPAAGPSVRKLALQLGIDLRRVKGTERGGRITLEDLKNYIQRLQKAAHKQQGAESAQTRGKSALPSIDFSKWGPITKQKLSTLRRTIGLRMHENWVSIPHVTQFDDADITDIMELRKKYAAAYEQKGGHLTVTLFAMKALIAALKQFPIFNTSLDETTGELIYKGYFHVGIAVDTEQGLIVPVIRDADKKSLLKLSIELNELAERTRQRKVGLEELQGGCFTISNLGSIGGSHFSPIVNKPEVAILGLGRGSLRPVVKGESKSPAVRLMLPVALSYDHRVIDGADGARFIRKFIESLEQISELDVKI